MKYEGIVIKLTKDKAIVTTDDFQCFYLKRSSTIYVGKHVEFTKNDIIRKRSVRSKLMLSAACILFLITCFLNLAGVININDILSKPKVFAYVNVDINPSLEIEIDGTGKVLGLVPLNEDAKVLIKKLKIGKISVSKAVDKIINEIKENKPISEVEKDYVLVSSTLNNEKNEDDKEYQAGKEKLDTIMNSLKKNIQEKGKVNVYLVQTNISEREDARNEGISTGRYILYKECEKLGNNFSIEEVKRANVNELLKGILGKKTGDSLGDTPSPTPSPLKVEDTKKNVSATTSDKFDVGEVTNITPSKTSTQMLIPTPTATPIPTPIPTPALTPTPISTQIPTPISTQIPTPTTRIVNSVYMKFESYNYPGQFIQHKIYFEAYISAKGILPDDCIFKIIPGLADPACISFESKNFPGCYLKNENFKIVLKPYDGSDDFNKSATFREVSGLADEKLTSIQPYNYPERYIRHKNFILQIDEIVSDADKEDATFNGIEVE